ncbi:FUSC family protein [Micromonospora sp. WMMD812]|uniref:FUSC family protein n=1 Tax=Micromonospora sp. WMMD812 TaxID=3015152 RepID=UPI00248AB945|nr:FUSC family protein [Micromonospora sp. WMMD812]WBB66107.1 FUSC family protein [Micromonospora sp. WMMD812]
MIIGLYDDGVGGADGSEVSVLSRLRRVPPGKVRREGQDLVERLRTYLIVAAQAGVAAGLAWFVASNVLHNPQPAFAPAVAVGTIAAAVGNRSRRTLELVAGVLVGALVGIGIVELIGVGPVQTGVVVTLSVTAAVLVRGSGAVMTQAGSTAVLLGTVSANAPDLAVPRTANALVGAGVALAVVLLILPLNPLRAVHRTAGPALDSLARELSGCAKALADHDVRRADEALGRLCGLEEQERSTIELIGAAREVAVLSPWRRRRLGIMRRYEQTAEHLERAYTNCREMAHWSVSTIRSGEPVPPGLPASIEHLSEAVRLLHREFLVGDEADRTRARLLQAARELDEACDAGVEFAGEVVVSKLRVTVTEVLQASGVPQEEANRQAGLVAEV